MRSWRHNNRIRYAFAYTARKNPFSVLTNGRRGVSSPYECSFGMDEHGIPTIKRSDLLITDDDGKSYILDLWITEASCQVNLAHAGRGQAGSMSNLHTRYLEHVRTGRFVTSNAFASSRLLSTRSAACTQTRPSSFTGPSLQIDWSQLRSSCPHATP